MDAVRDIHGLSGLWQAAGGGDPAIRVAIIDGPVDRGHPSIAGAEIEDGDAAGRDVRSEHGTHVTSILMGQPESSLVGVAPNCAAILFSIFREAPGGALEPTSQTHVARAIDAAIRRRADIINVSSGQLTPTGRADRILEDAVRRSSDAGSVIVAAAGNDGCRCLHVPAALAGVLSVGACDLQGLPLPFSNYGEDYLANGILAPGESIRGAAPGGGYATRTGTSFAAPIVTGVIALFLALARKLGLTVTAQDVRAALLAGASPCPDEQASARCLAGRLDIDGAARRLLGDDAAGSLLALGAPVGSEHQHANHVLTSRERAMSDPAGAVPSEAGQGAADAASPSPAVAPAPAGADPAAAQAAMMLQQGAAAPNTVFMPMPAFPAWGGHPGVAPQAMYQVAPGVAPAGMVPQAYQSPGAEAPSVPGSAGISPSAGNCECGVVRPSQVEDAVSEQVFVIGKLFYDFGTEARQDYFVHEIAAWRDSLGGRGDPSFGPDRDKAGDIAAPYNPEIMARFLLNTVPKETGAPPGEGMRNLPNANALIWTVNIDNVPVYALDPQSVFGAQIFASYVEILWFQDVAPFPPAEAKSMVTAEMVETQGLPADWPKGLIERVSQAGRVVGATTLLNGSVVPTLAPAWRGTYSWNIYDILGVDYKDVDQDWIDVNTWAQEFRGFLERIYNEFRNVGVSPQDRALNYSAMNARQTKQIFREMIRSNMRLDTVEIDRSSICRPDSDCWDVTYRFFNPKEVLTTAREVRQYTIDVSDVVPVPVGPLRRWQVA